MANNLTGDYEAVLQINARLINGILATMHQNAIDPGVTPTFPHNARVRVGGASQFNPKVTKFVTWVGTEVSALQTAGTAVTDYREIIQTKAPPGVAKVIAGLFQDVAYGLRDGSVGGWADVQISTPTINFAEGATTDVTLSVSIRARYQGDPGSTPLPEWIHGRIQVTYRIQVLPGNTVLRVQASPNDREILFFPAPGLSISAGDLDRITTEVRKALRTDFAVADLPLSNFPFFGFRALGSGDGQALALPFRVTPGPPPSGPVGNAGSQFLGTNEFAIALSKEAVKAQFEPTLKALREYRATVPVANIGYRVAVTGVDLIFNSGSVDLQINATATAPWPWPDFNNIVITQRLTLTLDGTTQQVSLLAADSDLTITGIWSSVLGYDIIGRVKNRIIAERNKALPAAQQAVAAGCYNARQGLEDGLKSFAKYATARYVTLEVTPDGIVLRGRIQTSNRLDPVVRLDELKGSGDFTAFRSWMPGGEITEYVWSWLERTSPVPWFCKVKTEVHPHEFIFAQPTISFTTVPGASSGSGIGGRVRQTFKITPINRICFGFNGRRITPDGHIEENVYAGESCKSTAFEPILTLPPYSIEAIIPDLNRPRPPEDAILNDLVGAHVNAFGQPRQPGAITANALIHFTGQRIEAPLQVMSQALAQGRNRDCPLLAILVLPMGSFEERASVIEAKLGPPGDDFGAHLIVTEDYGEGWTRAFDVRETPASHLINARGEFVWRQQGPLNAGELTRVFDEHLLQAPAPGTVLMQLNVQPGQPALEALFEDDQGNRHVFNRLRGRRVVLVFWKSWSAPCIRELRRLQQLHERGNAPVILAVNGGEECSVVSEVRREHGLTFPLIHDPGQAIGIRYGVQCWPTTVAINERGFVDRIHFGASHIAPAETTTREPERPTCA